MPTHTRLKLFTALLIAFHPTLSPHYTLIYAREGATRLVHVELYSSKTGRWTASAQTFSLKYFSAFDRRRGAVYWRGALHWLSRLHVYHFDAKNPRFIHVKDHRALCGITYGALDKLVVSRDCLLLVRLLQPLKKLSVYEMNNEHDYSAGWSVKYHVSLEPSVYFHVLSLVLGERDEDSFLVLEVTGKNMLLRYNIVANTFHQLCDLTWVQLCDTRFYSYFFTPSLVADV
ncbi:F-box protein At5g07610-like [Bidens hawaiensis]|uniref:F-box protein At5g07610-like n=1 Tax=Bidens hawaiensis TaxID=980011 RepID=UPI004049ED03